ncbi:protein phosphatase regulator [Saitoella coloradoensis]
MGPRPEVIRADTLDLQDRRHPSASAASSRRPPDFGDNSYQPHQQSALSDLARSTPSPSHGHNATTGFGDDDDDNDDSDDAGALSSSPSIPDSDIDFDYMYALHTFLPTVEGQAHSQKGDVLVLLDDSNSYWWLVRVVRDGSVGYLPAEHVETPGERMARLNKYRNVDVGRGRLEDHPIATGAKGPFRSFSRKVRRATSGKKSRNVEFGPVKYVQHPGWNPEWGEPSSDEESEDEDQIAEEQVREQMRTATDTVKATPINGAEPPRTSTLFRDVDTAETQLETVKFSLTPKIASDSTAFGNNAGEVREGERYGEPARKRSNSSSLRSEFDGEKKDKDEKKGVFGGLFKKRSGSKKGPGSGLREDTPDNEDGGTGEVRGSREVVRDLERDVTKTVPAVHTEGAVDDPQFGERPVQMRLYSHAPTLNEPAYDPPAPHQPQHQHPLAPPRDPTPPLSAHGQFSPVLKSNRLSRTVSPPPAPKIRWTDEFVRKWFEDDAEFVELLTIVNGSARLSSTNTPPPALSRREREVNEQLGEVWKPVEDRLGKIQSELDMILESVLPGVWEGKVLPTPAVGAQTEKRAEVA